MTDERNAWGWKTKLALFLPGIFLVGFNIGTGLCAERFEEDYGDRVDELWLFCLLVHRRIEELQTAEGPEDNFRNLLIAPASEQLAALSPREREVAYLLAQGVSQKECARLCKITPNTVAEYVKSAYKKLGINNRVALTHIVLHGDASASDRNL